MCFLLPCLNLALMQSNASCAALPSEESVSSHHPERGPIRGAEKDGRQRGRGGEERRAQIQGRIIDTEVPVACRGVFPFFLCVCLWWNSKQQATQNTAKIITVYTHTVREQTAFSCSDLCWMLSFQADVKQASLFCFCQPHMLNYF